MGRSGRDDSKVEQAGRSLGYGKVADVKFGHEMGRRGGV